MNVKGKDALRILVQRWRYGLYVIIGAIGIGLIWEGVKVGEGLTSAVLIGLGCGFLPTAVITLILLVLLPDTSDRYKALKKSGIIRIYNRRSRAAIRGKQMPRNRLEFISFGLYHFRSEDGNDEKLVRRIRKGLHVKILTLHPDSVYVGAQQQFENSGDLESDIRELIQWVSEIKREMGAGARGSIEIKLYDTLPLHFYCRADDKIWVGPYLPGKESNSVITYEFQAYSKLGRDFMAYFEQRWEDESNMEVSAVKDPLLLPFDQRKSIETVLGYFCRKLRGDAENAVIGVVVLFKQEQGLRRTLFSCNKGEKEKYNCHRMSAGAVGRLIELNQNAGSGRFLFFRDYEHEFSITLRAQGRTEEVTRSSINITPMRSDTDMRAILSAPIYIGDKMVGAVTFDFNSFSNEYKDSASELKQLSTGAEVNPNHLIYSWFDEARNCAAIVSHMLGNRMKSNYAKLYEERWVLHEGSV